MNSNSIFAGTTTEYNKYKVVVYVHNTRANRPRLLLPAGKTAQCMPFPEDGKAYGEIRQEVGAACFSVNNGMSKDCLIIATASDYVVNIVRLYVHDGYLGRNDVIIVYVDGIRHKKYEIKLDDNGSLEYYPKGFMEANSDVLLELMAPRKK